MYTLKEIQQYVETELQEQLPDHTDLIVWRKADQNIGVELTVDETRYYASYSASSGGLSHQMTYASHGHKKEVLHQLEVLCL